MRESLGLVETCGISTAIEVADVMVKAANVKILELENSRGSGYMTVKITGDVGAVKAAVDAAKAAGNKFGNLVSASVIPRPADGMAKLFCNPKVPYQSVNKKAIPHAWYDEAKVKHPNPKIDEAKEAKAEEEEKIKPDLKETEPEVKVEEIKPESKVTGDGNPKIEETKPEIKEEKAKIEETKPEIKEEKAKIEEIKPEIKEEEAKVEEIKSVIEEPE